MGRKRRSKSDAEGGCETGWCGRGGRCVAARGGSRVCVCAGPWGGARCTLYVGHDHACLARACPPPALCVWGPDVSATEAGSVYCACPENATCSPPPTGAREGVGAGAGAWIAALLVLLSLAAIAAVAALFFVHRRRQGSFVHARLADNVEISNPMYLAGEDDLDPRPMPGGNHFANPVYESLYAPAQHNLPPEEHANLLSSAADSPPAERAALL